MVYFPCLAISYIQILGQLPWNIKKDMNFFRQVTSTYSLSHAAPEAKNVVIMGRKTWESLPPNAKPLKDRINIVLSSNPKVISAEKEKKLDNIHVCSSLDESLAFVNQELGQKAGSVFLIGGQRVYEEGMANKNCKEVFLTRIGRNVECDTYMPDKFLQNYKHVETSKTFVEKDTPFVFQRYAQKEVYDQVKNSPLYFAEHHEEFQYLRLLDKLISEGTEKDDRTGVGTVSTFGEMMRYDLAETFPLLTTKSVFWRGVVEELLWFVRGQTDANILKDKGIHIWDGNTSREFLDGLGLKDRAVGDIGPGYGFQWRHFGAKYVDAHTDYTGQGVDQLAEIIHTIKTNPNSRRMILTAWNPAALREMALPPCHMMAQFYVKDNKLSCMLYQRSCDIGLGVPFNIASYALLLCMMAQVRKLFIEKKVNFQNRYVDYKEENLFMCWEMLIFTRIILNH